MQKDPKNFSMQDAVKMANTPAGQELLALLQQSDTSALQNAMEQASSGNYDKAKQMLQPLLASPQVQKLLRQLGGK